VSEQDYQIRHGRAVVGGVASGEALVLYRDKLALPCRQLEAHEVEREVERFHTALDAVRHDLEALRIKLAKLDSQDPTLILDAQIAVLNDPQLTEQTTATIRTRQINAEWALLQFWQEVDAIFAAIQDEYLRTRGEDVRQLVDRLTEQLLGGRETSIEPNAGHVIVASDLAPDEAIRYAQIPVAGIILESGTQTSHAVIIARTFGIPMIVGVEGILSRGQVQSGDDILVDADDAMVHINASASRRKAIHRRAARADERRRRLGADRSPAKTRDGVRIKLLANIELPQETTLVHEYGAEGVGLYRTEYLYLNRDMPPTFDELAAHYREVVESLGSLPVVFRTLDLGGDKLPREFKLLKTNNPALGLRGIRFSLRNPELLTLQLRAIARAADAHTQIMLPMVGNVEEVDFVRKLLTEAGLTDLELGAMIETPAAAITADLLAPHVGFMSIGTNDLIQYALAVDRSDEHVASLYHPTHPAILRLLKTVADAAHAQGVPVTICGEMAGDPRYALLLLGFGFRRLSMSPLATPLIRAAIRRIDLEQAQKTVTAALQLETADKIHALLEQEARRLFDDLLPA